MYEYKSELNAYRQLDNTIAETVPNEERLVDILEKNATNIGVISSLYDKIRSELKMNT